jgi:hypothetical protein
MTLTLCLSRTYTSDIEKINVDSGDFLHKSKFQSRVLQPSHMQKSSFCINATKKQQMANDHNGGEGHITEASLPIEIQSESENIYLVYHLYRII